MSANPPTQPPCTTVPRERRRWPGRLWAALWNLYARCYDRITALLPYREMLDEVTATLALAPGMRVLDAGCGTGVLGERLAASGVAISYVGVDLSPAMLARARARRSWPAGFSFVEGDLDDLLAADDAGFDRIASVNVIWTLPDPATTLARMTAALRPGGLMVHTTPQRAFKPYAIVWRHLRGHRGWAFLRALAALPLLMVAGLLNLVLVMQSGIRARGAEAGKRWDRDGLLALLSASGAAPREPRRCYADQDLLLVATRAADPLASRA